jgi:hypothetical protein
MFEEASMLGYDGPEYSHEDAPHQGSPWSSSKGSKVRTAHISVHMQGFDATNGLHHTFTADMRMLVDVAERPAPLVCCSMPQFEAMWQMDFVSALQQSGPAPAGTQMNSTNTATHTNGALKPAAEVPKAGGAAPAYAADTSRVSLATNSGHDIASDLSGAALQTKEVLSGAALQTNEVLSGVAAPNGTSTLAKVPQSHPLPEASLQCSGESCSCNCCEPECSAGCGESWHT